MNIVGNQVTEVNIMSTSEATSDPVAEKNLDTQMSSLQLQNGIKIHEFRAHILDMTFFFQVTNLGKSIYIWVGNGDGAMNDLALAAITPYDKKGMPTTTKIIGSTSDNLSESFAAKLTKKLGKPVYVSFNVDLGAMYNTILTDIQDRLYEEIAMCPDKF